MGAYKLHSGHKRIMTLIQRDAADDGWTIVSKTLFPHVYDNMPAELVASYPLQDGSGKARLTAEGKIVLKWWDRLGN